MMWGKNVLVLTEFCVCVSNRMKIHGQDGQEKEEKQERKRERETQIETCVPNKKYHRISNTLQCCGWSYILNRLAFLKSKTQATTFVLG